MIDLQNLNMDDKGFLEHEEELRKMNSELEQRTRQWMKDIVATVNGDDAESWISEVSHEKELNRLTRTIFNDDTSSVSSVKRKHKGVVKRRETEVLPDATRGLSSESMIRFLRAKVSLLHNQQITLQHQLTTTTENLRRVETELKQSDDEKTKSNQELALLKEKLRKQEQFVTDLTEKNHLKLKENNLLKKETEIMKRDTKKAMATSTSYELKLNKAKEEIDRLKFNLKLSQNSEKEARDDGKGKNEELTQSLRKLEKQKSELISAFRKQLCIIENLKKQKTLIQVNRILKHSDEEFLKLLDWTAPDV